MPSCNLNFCPQNYAAWCCFVFTWLYDKALFLPGYYFHLCWFSVVQLNLYFICTLKCVSLYISNYNVSGCRFQIEILLDMFTCLTFFRTWGWNLELGSDSYKRKKKWFGLLRKKFVRDLLVNENASNQNEMDQKVWIVHKLNLYRIILI